MTKLTENQIEIEVSFPAYRKSEVHYWKVISPEICLLVTVLGNESSIAVSTYVELAYTCGENDSTKEEFETNYNSVLKSFSILNEPEIQPIYNDNNEY